MGSRSGPGTGPGTKGPAAAASGWGAGTLVEAGEEVAVGEAEPGDLVFVRAEDTPLGAMVSELDGCAYSHVGVLAADPEPTLLNARTDRHGRVSSPDLGGVRRNRLADLEGRGLGLGRLRVDPAVRAAGLALLETWVEPDAGPHRVSRSRFSYVKLVVVATALAAVRRRDPLDPDRAGELWEAALGAAEAFHWTGPFPGFYCAEVVAAAYGLGFTVGDLCVPDAEPHPVGLAPPPARPVPDRPPADVVVDLRDRLRIPSFDEALRGADDVIRAMTQIDLTAAQAAAVVEVAVAVLRHDRDLFRALRQAAAELEAGAAPARRGHRPRVVLDRGYRPPPFLALTDPLPTALVTPRMLLSHRVVTSVHPLRL